MACLQCKANINEFPAKRNCLDIAIEIIQNHFKAYESAQQAHNLEIDKLQQQNLKLRRAVALLKKREIPRPTNTQEGQGKTTEPANNYCSMSDEDDESAISDLNVALSMSRQPMDFSTIESTPPDAANEVIGGTEDIRQSRGILRGRLKPAQTMKEKEQPFRDHNSNKRTFDSISSFDKANKKPLLLSLNKHMNAKMKQTRLPFSDRSFENTFIQQKKCTLPLTNSKTTNQLAHTPPNHRNSAPLKPAKTALSWILNNSNKTPEKDEDFLEEIKEVAACERTMSLIGHTTCLTANSTTFLPSGSDESVQLIPPQSPEIVMLDDTPATMLDVSPTVPLPIILHTLKREQVDEELAKMKAEQITGGAHMLHAEQYESEEESEEFMVRPILIKDEPITPKKRTIKERFDIDCVECEKFLEYVGRNMSDAELEAHIQRCTLHKTNDDDGRSTTPPGFWYPHMLSFADNDPRKEVLVDRRFSKLSRK